MIEREIRLLFIFCPIATASISADLSHPSTIHEKVKLFGGTYLFLSPYPSDCNKFHVTGESACSKHSLDTIHVNQFTEKVLFSVE